MVIKTVWAVYFSGTGTTEKVATYLAENLARRLGAEYKAHNYTQPAGRKEPLSFGPEDLVVLGTPVYAGRVPNLLLPFIQENIHGEGALAVPVVLYGNRNFDDGLMELRNVLGDNGFTPVAAAAAQTREGWSEGGTLLLHPAGGGPARRGGHGPGGSAGPADGRQGKRADSPSRPRGCGGRL